MRNQETLRQDDGALVRRTLAGEQNAFAALVSHYRDMVYGMAYHSLDNPEDAQDAAQEAFVHAYARLGQLRDPNRFAPWLRRMTLNVCMDLRRRQIPLLRHEVISSVLSQDQLTTRLQVREALSRLSEKTRLVVTLIYLSGYSHAEVASFLEIPINTVRSRLQHAKNQLREEMQDMVNDTLQQDKPDDQWTLKVVDEALRRGKSASQSFQRSEAVRHYDEALSALDTLKPSRKRKRLMLQALRQKEHALDAGRSHGQALALLTQALDIAQEIGDFKAEAQLRQELGVTYVSQRSSEKALTSFLAALALYEQMEDTAGQGECLMSLGLWAFEQNKVMEGRHHFEQALPLLEAAQYNDWAAVARAMLNLLNEIGEARLPHVTLWRAVCDVLNQHDGKTSFHSQPGYQITRQEKDDPPALFVGSVFFQISHLRLFLEQNLSIGKQWSGYAFSYSDHPLQATVTVLGQEEQITTPAGTFSACLLTEQVTAWNETANPDELTRWHALNLYVFCGTTRAWYAPGVGLVQVEVQHGDGVAVTIQLQRYSVAGKGNNYLPLAVGNHWTYCWANIPNTYDAKEVYRVASCKDDLWYLEHYAYVAKRENL